MVRWFWNRRWIILLLITLSVVHIPRSHAEGVTLNLRDADLNALTESISQITGRNFIVDPRVKGRVSIISSKPMNPDEVYEVFLAILAVHGFAAVPGDKVTKIVPSANAKQETIPTLDHLNGDGPDQVVTRVIQVQNVSAAQIVPILRPLIPPQGHLAAYPPTNVLIISDSAGNVERIADIISRMDKASDLEVEVIPLKHASATDIVRVLTALEQGQAQAAQGAGMTPARLVADERTNSVLLTGDNSARLRLRALIAHLDTPLESGGNTQVIYLRYAKATELVNVLKGVSQKITPEGAGNVPPPPVPLPGQSGGRFGDTLVDIQADEATNSLVITAPPDIIRSLRAVIAQLDIRRAQVLVEAAIAEISTRKTAELGVQWIFDGSNGGYLVGVTNFTLGTSLAQVAGAVAAIAQGNVPSTVPPGVNVGVGNFAGSNRFAAIISALATDADTNVLSTPTLVTLDNEEAKIVVGENRPFVTGSFTTSGSGVDNPFQTIERRDVGLTLTIKPQINEGNAVQLEISQEVENVVDTTAQGPTTTKRSVKTTVIVEDGQILVLGGLIDDTLNEGVQKIPGLGDIPVVGNLFRYRQTTKQKRNLMVFLHPVILRDAQSSTLSTSDKYSYIRAQQIAARQRGVALLPEVSTPLLTPQEQVEQQKSLLNLQPHPQIPPNPALQQGGAEGGRIPAPTPPARSSIHSSAGFGDR